MLLIEVPANSRKLEGGRGYVETHDVSNMTVSFPMPSHALYNILVHIYLWSLKIRLMIKGSTKAGKPH